GPRSDDRTGYAYVLLIENAAALPAPVRNALTRHGVEVLSTEDASDLSDWLHQHDVKAALVRPDRYVRGAARTDAELDLLIATACPPADVPSAAKLTPSAQG